MPELPSSPLVSAEWLRDHLHDPDLRVLDCRFDLRDALSGQFAYLTGHVPGAVYVNLETDLSGPVQPGGAGGRHPLPDAQALAARLGELGVGDAHTVVAYDDPRAGGGMFAARAWWLLRWLGHDRVRVLDGGWPAWVAAGADVSDATPEFPPAPFAARPRDAWVASAQAVADRAAGTALLDSRAAPRYRGEVEPLDTKAGHIPGALNADWAGALDEHGFWRPAGEQAARLSALNGRQAIVYCGSGVSAAANLLALAVTGREPGEDTQLYAGSWSDWISDDARPTATGDESSDT